MKLPSSSVAFDQPLFIKTDEIAPSKKLDKLVIRIGFHLLMSAIGSIFHTMRGSRINEVLCRIFGPNVIVHILSVQAISRALCVLFVLDTSLTIKLLEQIIPTSKKQKHAKLPMRQMFATVCDRLWSSAIVCDRLRPFAIVCDHLRSFATACARLRPFATVCDHLRSFATVWDRLRRFAMVCDYLRLCTSTNQSLFLLSLLHCHVIHLTIVRRFSWPSLAYMCTYLA